MASAPETLNLQTQDYPPEHKGLLDRLLPTLQRQFDAVRANLGGGLTRANSAGQDVSVTINTPVTDFVNATLQTTAGQQCTSTDANSNGFASPRYAIRPGQLIFDGACEASPTGTGTGTVAIPWTFITGLPIPVNAPTGSAPGANVDQMCNFVEVNTTGAFHAVSWAGPALVRWAPGAGTLQLRSAGVGFNQPAAPWGIPFLTTTVAFTYPNIVVPPLSCFPITVQTTVQNPTRITISKITDVTPTQSGTSPISNIAVYAAPSTVNWASSAPGQFTITNITGLQLGRQYKVDLAVEP